MIRRKRFYSKFAPAGGVLSGSASAGTKCEAVMHRYGVLPTICGKPAALMLVGAHGYGTVMVCQRHAEDDVRGRLYVRNRG